jgi:hypothetical protein
MPVRRRRARLRRRSVGRLPCLPTHRRPGPTPPGCRHPCQSHSCSHHVHGYNIITTTCPLLRSLSNGSPSREAYSTRLVSLESAVSVGRELAPPGALMACAFYQVTMADWSSAIDPPPQFIATRRAVGLTRFAEYIILRFLFTYHLVVYFGTGETSKKETEGICPKKCCAFTNLSIPNLWGQNDMMLLTVSIRQLQNHQVFSTAYCIKPHL